MSKELPVWIAKDAVDKAQARQMCLNDKVYQWANASTARETTT